MARFSDFHACLIVVKLGELPLRAISFTNENSRM